MMPETGNGHELHDIPPMDGVTEVMEIRAAASVLLDRLQFMRQAGISFRGARDLYEIFGYDRVLGYSDYEERYRRGGLAKRIVEAYPKATWRGGIKLYEDEDPTNITEFEQAWLDLELRLKIWATLQRVDILAGLSTYAVLLIGAPGALDTELPRGDETAKSLLYLSPFSGGGGPGGANTRLRGPMWDADCSILEFETNIRSARFGLPLWYQLKRTELSSPDLQKKIHWSRIIHVAEGCLNDDVYGTPTLESVWNLLDDLDKVTGGGAEAFFLRANQGMHLDIAKDMALPDAKAAIENLRTQSEEYANGITRWLRTRGVTVTPLGSDTANFGPPADAILTQIAGSKGIPKRILIGSEMGQLASGQDADNWNTQVNDRRTSYAMPFIIRPLVDRLIRYGYLPKPTKYDVAWPVIQNLTETEKSAGASQWASVNATAKQTIFSRDEIRQKWFGLKPGSELDTESFKADGAQKWAMVNKIMGRTIFTDDEIRRVWYGFKPLPPEERTPVTDPAKPGAPGTEGAPGALPTVSEVPPRALPPPTDDIAAVVSGVEPGTLPTDDLEAVIKSLEKSLSDGDVQMIDRILENISGVSDPLKLQSTLRALEEAVEAGDSARIDEILTLGGKGSGNYGHGGRPGKVGGSTIGYHTQADRLLNHPDVLKELKIPDTLYHITIKRNVPSILKHGLKLRQDRSNLEGQTRGIHLSNDPVEIYSSDIALPGNAVVAVKTKGLKFRLDPEFFDIKDEYNPGYEMSLAGAKEYVRDVNKGDKALVVYTKAAIPSSHVSKTNIKLPQFKGMGGKGSGDHGHAGRPGQIGGSGGSGAIDPETGVGYTTQQLLDAAEQSGTALFGAPTAEGRGVIFDRSIFQQVIHSNLKDVAADDPELAGEEGDPDNPALNPYVDDFEFQFYPSTGKAVDVSGEHLSKLTPDTDGNIYLYYPGEDGIRVIHTDPDFETPDYEPRSAMAGPHEFSSVQAPLPLEIAEQLFAAGDRIPDSELAEEGRETDAHVTVKYGLHTDDVSDVEEFTDGYGPISLTFGETGYFAGDEYDVLFVEVDSPELVELNALISEGLSVTDTYPEYHPHATIAYLKSGLGARYAGNTEFVGKTAVINQVLFSPADGEKQVLDLSLQESELQTLGGKGSGNFGHSGRFHHVGGSGPTKGKMVPTGMHRPSERDAKRLEKMRIPPAWTNVFISNNPNAPLQATGLDSKGRRQSLYSAKHTERAAAEKFERLKAFRKELPRIRAEMAKDMAGTTPKETEPSSALFLIERTGMRIGGEGDTRAEKKAYGASNLEARHVKITGDRVDFDFIGKKGVRIELTVSDKELAKMLKPRVAKGGRLFDTDAAGVRAYMKSITKEFTPKDFRTYVGTAEAIRVANTLPKPKTPKEYKKRTEYVGHRVSLVLGNTQKEALKSYIDPAVFHKWQIK